MVFDSPRDWSHKQWLAAALLGAFAVAMLPPGVLLVNESTLVGGYPLLYLWALGWSLFGILVLFWASRENLFGITGDQVPPELAEGSDGARADSSGGVSAEASPEESAVGGDR